MQGAVVSLINDCVCAGCCHGRPWKDKLGSGMKDIFDKEAFCYFSDDFYPFEEKGGVESWHCCDHRDGGVAIPSWVISS